MVFPHPPRLLLVVPGLELPPPRLLPELESPFLPHPPPRLLLVLLPLQQQLRPRHSLRLPLRTRRVSAKSGHDRPALLDLFVFAVLNDFA